MTNQEIARGIYLDWVGIPKPRDTYPVGDHAQKLIDQFTQALDAKESRIKKVQEWALQAKDVLNMFNRPKFVFDNDWRGKEEAQAIYRCFNAFPEDLLETPKIHGRGSE